MTELTLFSFIDAAAVDGSIGLQLPVKGYAHTVESGTKQEKLRTLIGAAFHGHHLFTGHLDMVKKHVVDIESDYLEDEGQFHLRLNLCKFFFLPGAEPKAELADLRRLFEAMKLYFEEVACRKAGVSIHNNRDHKGRVYGSFFLNYAGRDKQEEDPVCAKHTAVLDELVAGSAALQHFLRSVALSLGKPGPWSWATLREDQLWGDDEGPGYKKWRAQYDARKLAETAD